MATMLLQCAVLCTLLLQQVSFGASETSRVSRAAIVANEINIWRDGMIYYVFDESISNRLQNMIRDAMNGWEDGTCLLFRPREADQPDYIEFYSSPNEQYCTGDSVGRKGGKQRIKLGYSCQSKGEILHLLGHLVGFWNEQARPDRDKFVRINFDNIENGQEANFEKRDDFDIDYQGIGYDYASIMHLRAAAYSKDGSDTTEVLDQAEYERQGKPLLGQRSGLSSNDTEQANALYSCSAEGHRGILKINIMNAETLGHTVNPRVEITVVDASGTHTVLSTTEKQHETSDVRNPVWDESFQLPMDGPPPFAWQFFRLRILGGEAFDDVPISMSETVRISPGLHPSLKHCIDSNCNGFLTYSYEFLPDRNECDPNPCMNGGTCVDGFVDYECNCIHGWGAKDCDEDQSGDSCDPNPCSSIGTLRCVDGFFDFTCECRPGYLGADCSVDACAGRCPNDGTCIREASSRGYRCQCRPGFGSIPVDGRTCEPLCFDIRIRNARDLKDDDPGPTHSDPYVKLYTFSRTGRRFSEIRTGAKSSTANPDWSLSRHVACGHDWDRFEFEIWDEDDGFFRGEDDLQYKGRQSIHPRRECCLEVDLSGRARIYFDYYVYIPGGPSNTLPGSCNCNS